MTDSVTAPKVKITVLVDEELVTRTRGLVRGSPDLTVSGLVETALKKELAKAETRRGQPIKLFRGRLKTGRPIR